MPVRDTQIITLMLIVILTFIPVSCFTGATLLALRQRKGWGWLIVAGVLTTVAVVDAAISSLVL
ncbi:hypothetical protein [Pantoea dispersa]|uniref:hypothetical protein n=1 Tax=Pantoea dispersa TaxID=59814 RepID=UPI0024AF54D6|nr:hypothetical protein [Pantoea dispersa]MDI6636424.1 hypothetical protein [Pantoea dispersa]